MLGRLSSTKNQDDNAGPQIDKTYKDRLQAEFDIDRRGWKLEHQAPQGPYTNVLDLQMFPATNKRHSELLQLQLYFDNEANAERIWKAARCTTSMAKLLFIHGLQSAEHSFMLIASCKRSLKTMDIITG